MIRPVRTCVFFLFVFTQLAAQPVEKRIGGKIEAILDLPMFQHALVSLCVADASTGQTVYQLNDQIGLAPASNMKVFTAIAALDLLGSGFRYETKIGYSGQVEDSVLYGNLYITGAGDPTTGSWRYPHTKSEMVMAQIAGVLRRAGIYKLLGHIVLDGSCFGFNPVPGGWEWDDMGIYYGAGAWGLNWHENQYDMVLRPGRNPGDSVAIVSTAPQMGHVTFVNELKTAAAGTGDQSYTYLPPYGTLGIIEGTIPAGGLFTVSGSVPEPYTPFAAALQKMFADSGFLHTGSIQSSINYKLAHQQATPYGTLAGTLVSPPLDSIVYWFMKKSVNLYGEALVKTLALARQGHGSTDVGIEIIKHYWDSLGLEKSALRIADGSGLSSKSRVTTNGLVKALLYARKRSWYKAFYQSLPLYNGMHMKSGTISGVKSFSGYQQGSGGREYVFSMIINNYDGPASAVVEKMYSVLDELKK